MAHTPQIGSIQGQQNLDRVLALPHSGGLSHYFHVDVLGPQYKSVNFGAETCPGSRNWCSTRKSRNSGGNACMENLLGRLIYGYLENGSSNSHGAKLVS
jgi:hypothetical protein